MGGSRWNRYQIDISVAGSTCLSVYTIRWGDDFLLVTWIFCVNDAALCIFVKSYSDKMLVGLIVIGIVFLIQCEGSLVFIL